MMETYLLKSSLSLIILYGLYRIILRYEFNHQLNRFIGLACIVFSATFPFLQFIDPPQINQLPGTFYVVAKGTADFQEAVSSAVSHNTISIILLLYAIGASVFLLRCVVGLATLCRFYVNSPKSYQGGFTVVTLNRSISPFTFFKVLFVGNNKIEDSEWKAMLLHEQVHRDQYHSIDAVLLEALTIIFWFNPVIWFFQRHIKAEHEYHADECVLQAGLNPIAYQLILFKTRTGTSIEVGNYLSNKTSLTKRFMMMTKIKSTSKGSYLRASLFLVLMSVILLLGAFSGRNEESQVDKIPTYKQGEAAMYRLITRQIKYPTTARNENRSGLVRVSFTVNKNGRVENVKVEEEEGNIHFLKSLLSGIPYPHKRRKGLMMYFAPRLYASLKALVNLFLHKKTENLSALS